MSENGVDHSHYQFSNNNTQFLVIRDLQFDENDIIKIEINKTFTLVYDFDNLSKKLDLQTVANFIKTKSIKPKNLIIKNCLIDNNNISNFFKDLNLKLSLLYISDELDSISPNLKNLFGNIKTKKLVLKKMKINSKLQLTHFLDFIINTGCEELILEDIFIELIIKKDDNDETYNKLDEYFTLDKGIIYKYLKNDKKETSIKNLKMIDCPLFTIKNYTFKNIYDYKDISIDIDENSLLNPSSLITKFKIKKGYCYICFDLDSFKSNDDEEKDYLYYLDYIFDIILNNNKDNYNFKKLKFKNFDITKYEYITGENLTFIDEKNWVLNDEENKRKKNLKKNKELNKKINDNLDKLSKIKELIFDNCSNHFMELILKFINSKKEKKLDYLKIKKNIQI